MTAKKPPASQNGNTSRHKNTEPKTVRLPIGVTAVYERRAAQLTKETGQPVTGHALLIDVITTYARNQLADEIERTGITPPGVAIVRYGDTIEVLSYGPPMK